jgi:hypothetical protein
MKNVEVVTHIPSSEITMAKNIYQKPIDNSQDSNLDNATRTAASPSMVYAIRDLPGQYLKVLTRPSVNTFVEEKDKARWGIIWFQLIILAVIDTILLSISLLMSPHNINSLTGVNNMSPAMLQSSTIILIVLLQLALTPLSFLVAGGILYLIARLLGGTGTFLEQIYTTLLFGVPLVILSYLLLLIQATSNWLPYLPHIYSLVLFVLSLIAVHKLGRGKAIAVIVIPICLLLLLAFVGTILLANFIHR